MILPPINVAQIILDIYLHGWKPFLLYLGGTILFAVGLILFVYCITRYEEKKNA